MNIAINWAGTVTLAFIAASVATTPARAATTWSASTQILTDSNTQLEWIKTTEVTARQAEGFQIATVAQARQLALDSGFTVDGRFSQPVDETPNGILSFSIDATGVVDSNPAISYRLGLVASDAQQTAANQVMSIESAYNSPRIDVNSPYYRYLPAYYSYTTTFAAPGAITANLYSFKGLAQNAQGAWYVSPGGSSTYNPTSQTYVYTPLLTTQVAHLMVRSVPEAGTWAMMALGLAGLFGVKRMGQIERKVAVRRFK